MRVPSDSTTESAIPIGVEYVRLLRQLWSGRDTRRRRFDEVAQPEAGYRDHESGGDREIADAPRVRAETGRDRDELPDQEISPVI